MDPPRISRLREQVYWWSLHLSTAVTPAPAVVSYHLPCTPPLGSVKRQLGGSTVESFGPSAPASFASSRHQPRLIKVTLDSGTFICQGQQRIFKVIQTQQPHLTDRETESREEKGLAQGHNVSWRQTAKYGLALAGRSLGWSTGGSVVFVFDARVSRTRGNGRSHRRLAPRPWPGPFDMHTSPFPCKGGAVSFYRGGKLRTSHFPQFHK